MLLVQGSERCMNHISTPLHAEHWFLILAGYKQRHFKRHVLQTLLTKGGGTGNKAIGYTCLEGFSLALQSVALDARIALAKIAGLLTISTTLHIPIMC